MAAFTLSGGVTVLPSVFGNLIFGSSTTPDPPGPGEDACSNCPDYIRAPVEKVMENALEQVQIIKKRTAFINEALKDVTAAVTSTVQAVVDDIPLPPVFDLSELLNTFKCPLTPVALTLDPSLLVKFDPTTLWKRVQEGFRGYLSEIVANYEADLQGLAGADVVALAKNYFEDMKRTEFEEIAFAYAVAISAYVLGVCPITHANGIYAEFDAAVADFDLTGFVPILTLDPPVRDLILVLGEGETKIEAWRIAATQSAAF